MRKNITELPEYEEKIKKFWTNFEKPKKVKRGRSVSKVHRGDPLLYIRKYQNASLSPKQIRSRFVKKMKTKAVKQQYFLKDLKKVDAD